MLNNKERKLALNVKENEEINLDEYNFSTFRNEQPSAIDSIHELKKNEVDSLASVGVLMEEENRSGTYLLYGHDAFTIARQIEGFECLPIAEALQKYHWLREKYWFKALNKNLDKYTSAISSTIPSGYFIHVKKGVKIEFPFQAGLFMNQENDAMSLHNVVILEEGAEINLITGCTNKHKIRKGLHLAISEHFIGRNAKLTNSMIHNWGPEFEVRPRGGTIVEEGGTYISNYFSLRPAKSVQMDPFTHLKGDNSSAKYLTVILSTPGTFADLGGRILMTGKNSGAELVARAVCQGGYVIQTGLIIGAASNCRAHVDCAGLMMSEKGMIEAIPGLRAMHPEARMSHEASIGRVAPGQVAYLQSKGLTEEEALSMIVRGFLDIGVEIFIPELDSAISEIAEISGHGEE